jgi:hypothetical protein
VNARLLLRKSICGHRVRTGIEESREKYSSDGARGKVAVKEYRIVKAIRTASPQSETVDYSRGATTQKRPEPRAVLGRSVEKASLM